MAIPELEPKRAGARLDEFANAFQPILETNSGTILISTKRLQIVEGHQLVTDGLFRYVRHPLYFGRILAMFGFVLVFSSLWGVVLIAISVVFFLVRIQIEEDMLTQAFGDEYREYQKTTKKLIPFIY